MKYWLISLLLSGFIISGCVHSKKNQTITLPAESENLTTFAKAKNIGEVLKTNLDHPDASIIELLEACSKNTCDLIFEKGVAARLKALHLALVAKNSADILSQAQNVRADFHKLISLYSEQREYIVPVIFQAWFLAGAIYPYSKSISEDLFQEIKSIQKKLDQRSPKPSGYFFFVALETEYQKVPAIEKVQAYKRCIDEEPSNSRCQESYLRLSAQAPKAIKASEANLAKECRPAVDKSGFSLRIGTSLASPGYSGPKPFNGKKYYIDRQDFLAVSEIEGILWNKKGLSVTLKVTDAGVKKIRNASIKIKDKGLLLVKKEMIFAAAQASAVFSEDPQEIHFLSLDKKGLSELVQKCP